MKKKNMIIIGVIALILVVTVGYALFSDTLNITGSATAKGDFEITTTCDENVSSALGNMPQQAGSVTDSSINCSSNIVNISATLGYPGSYKYYKVKMTNTGNIPAKLNKIVELNNPEIYTFSKENGVGGAMENCKGDSSNQVCATLFSSLTWLDDYSISDDDSFDISWYVEQFDAVLDPGETAYFYVKLEWLQASTQPGEPLTANLNAEVTWQQATN